MADRSRSKVTEGQPIGRGLDAFRSQRLCWLSVIADLTLVLLFGVIAFFLYPYFIPLWRTHPRLSNLNPRTFYERTYRGLTWPCHLHKDGGLPHAGCIRLVRISQAPDGDRILWPKVFPIASAPSYRALSYTWGHSKGKPDQHSATTSFEYYKGSLMPYNLMSVIDRLSRLNLEGDDKSGWYWIDYICIAQDNIRERGEQVGNMHRIYQQAEGVDIWLGPAGEHEASQVTGVLRYVLHYADSPSGANRTRHELSVHLLPKSDWEILADFYSRRWFHRLWTLQEFALASNVRIILGDDYINSTLLWHATTYLYSRGFPLPLDYGQNRSTGYAIVQHSMLRNSVEDTDQLLSLLPSFAPRENQMPEYETVLVWVFWRSVATFATDARDYIYGILGVAEAIMDRLGQTGCHDKTWRDYLISRCVPAYTPIQPDYSLDTARVFQEFIIRLMHSSIGIRAITLIQGSTQIGELQHGREFQRHAKPTWIDQKGTLPSWVPNLAHKDIFPLYSYGASSVVAGETTNYALPKRNLSYDIFSSSSNFSSVQRFYITGTDLHVFGRLIGVVKFRSNRLPYAAQLLPCVEFTCSTLEQLAEATPANLVAGVFEPAPNALESLLHTLGLGSWKDDAASKHAPKEDHTALLDPRRMETFFAGGLSFLVCMKMHIRAFHGQPLDLGVVLNELDVARYSKIPGLPADFLEAQVAKWRAPEMIFRWKTLSACISHPDIQEDVVDSQAICSTLVNGFPWARGRSVSSITLEPQLAEGLYVAGNTQIHRGGNVSLSALVPDKVKSGDEIWALQGSEWPFVLRRRYRHHDDEATTGNKFSVIRCRWWWPWNSDVANRSRTAVYELLGDAYVHGLMNGELGAQISQNLEEIIIS